MRYPIYANYDPTQEPVGFVDLNGGVLLEPIHKGAIIPKLSRAGDEGPFTLVSFGLVPRTQVDTSPWKL